MITNFEEETKPLTAFEEQMKEHVINVLKLATGKEKAIRNGTISALVRVNQSAVLSPERIRKIINHIRTNNEVSCLVASSRGYYIAQTKEEAERHLKSLYERSMSILNVYSKLKDQAEEKFNQVGQLKIDL